MTGQSETKPNVKDYMQAWENEFIVNHLNPTRAPFVVAAENVTGDFHKANIMRTAEGFNFQEFWFVGKRQWDRRGAVGTQHRLPFNHAPDLNTMLETIPDSDSYTIVTLDNVPGSVSLVDYVWPEKVIMIVGEEQRGVSSEAVDIANDVLHIPMRGAVRSFSVSTAAGMAMFHYSMQRKFI